MTQKTVYDRIRSRTKPETRRYVQKNLAVVAEVSRLLKQKGWTQKDLAKKLGKTESEVSKWLSGLHNLTLKSIAKIETVLEADLLKVPVIQTDKLFLTEIVLLKSAVTSNDAFLENPEKPDSIEMGLLSDSKFDFSNKECRFRLHITLDGKNPDGNSSGLGAEFMLDFIYVIENLPDFILDQNGENHVDALLGATLLGISFSTTRGIVMERTKGTLFAGFILPIINPMKSLFMSNPNAVTALPIEVGKKKVKG